MNMMLMKARQQVRQEIKRDKEIIVVWDWNMHRELVESVTTTVLGREDRVWKSTGVGTYLVTRTQYGSPEDTLLEVAIADYEYQVEEDCLDDIVLYQENGLKITLVSSTATHNTITIELEEI